MPAGFRSWLVYPVDTNGLDGTILVTGIAAYPEGDALFHEAAAKAFSFRRTDLRQAELKALAFFFFFEVKRYCIPIKLHRLDLSFHSLYRTV